MMALRDTIRRARRDPGHLASMSGLLARLWPAVSYVLLSAVQLPVGRNYAVHSSRSN
jgi:hypothetical protein